MSYIRIAMSIICLCLAAIVFIDNVEGQENQTASQAQISVPRIVWQKELDSEIRYRRYMGHNISGYPDMSEPNVGIFPGDIGVNPISMVATFKWVYLFDEEGHIEQRIPLRRDIIPDEVKALTALTLPDYIKRGGDKREFISESVITDPKGRFYIIRTEVTRGYDGWRTRSIRAFNADGSLRFELRNRRDEDIFIKGEFYISPNGYYLTIFDSGWDEAGMIYLDFYDNTGRLLKHISSNDFLVQYDFAPFDLMFSEDGSHVILTGFKTKDLLIFDGQGHLIQRIGDVRAKSATVFQEQHSIKQEIYRQFVDTQIPLREQPEGVHDIKMLKDRNRGVYISGNTLYLFELQLSP